MITVRHSLERGKSNPEWLLSSHTFSFGNYYDPKFMGFSSLRVINEDRVAPTQGFGTHSHANMEILTYVLSGTLAHKDSLHNQSELKRGEVQLMTAGRGVSHSEFNPSSKEEVHFLQIWILPNQKDLNPTYQQKSFLTHNSGLQLIASPTAQEGSLLIHQDAKIYLGRLEKAETCTYIATDRHVWIQMIQGSATLNGLLLKQGDGAAINQENRLTIQAEAPTEFLLFDLL